MLTALEKAKTNGAKIVAVNPLPEAGPAPLQEPAERRAAWSGAAPRSPTSTCQIRLGGDLALFQAIGRLLLRPTTGAGQSSTATSSTEHTVGFDDVGRARRASSTGRPCVRATGLDRGRRSRPAARMLPRLRSAPSSAGRWASPSTATRSPTITEIANVAAAAGQHRQARRRALPGARPLQRPGRPHDGHLGAGRRSRFLDALRRPSSASTPPREHGLDTVDAIRAMRDGKAKVFFGMGGNFVSATPDTDVTEAALRSAALTVQVSTKLNRSHVVTGREALILPTLGRTEQRHHRRPASSRCHRRGLDAAVHASRGPLEPAVDAAALARSRSSAGWPRPLLGDRPRRAVGRVRATTTTAIRDRDRRRRARLRGLTTSKVRRPGGFALPHPPRDPRDFPTEHGQGQLHRQPARPGPHVPAGRLLLQTLRSHDQYNTTIYGLDDRYRGIKGGRRVVFVNPDDIDRARPRRRRTGRPGLGVGDGQLRSAAPGLPGGGLPDHRAAAPRRTTRRPTCWCRWTPPRPGRIRRFPRRSSFDWTTPRGRSEATRGRHIETGHRTTAGQPRHRRRRGDATGYAGRRGADGAAGRRPAARGHDAHSRARRRAGPRVPAHRGRDHRSGASSCPRATATRSTTPGRTPTTCWTSRSPPASPRRRPASSGTSTPRRRAASAARRAWTRCDCAAGSRPAGDTARIEAATLYGLPDALRAAQRVFDSTGGLHAAGLFTADGAPLVVREDVGRHNAVDKVLGWALLNGRVPAGGLRADGLGARVVRARAEGGDGRRPGARRGVGAVVARGRSGRRGGDDPGRVPAGRVDERLHPAGPHQALKRSARSCPPPSDCR